MSNVIAVILGLSMLIFLLSWVGLIYPKAIFAKSRQQVAFYVMLPSFLVFLFISIFFIEEEVPNETVVSEKVDKAKAKSEIIAEELLSSSNQKPVTVAHLKSTLEGLLGEKNNLEKDYIRNISVNGQGEHILIMVDFNASDNLTTKMRLSSLKGDMAKIHKAIYSQGYNPLTVIVSAYYPLMDQYGNEIDGLVYRSQLKREEADKVNWDIDDAVLRRYVLPGVWHAYKIHPEFKDIN